MSSSPWMGTLRIPIPDWLVLILMILGLMGQIGGGRSGTDSPQVISTRLSAKWAPTSLLAEGTEFIGELEPGVYWSFLEGILERTQGVPGPLTDEVEADLVSITAYNLISPSKLRLLEWALTSRAYSPKVNMFQQLIPDGIPTVLTSCPTAFVHYGENKFSCDLTDLKRVVELGEIGPQFSLDSSVFVTESDHKFPSFVWNLVNPPVAVLYGKLNSAKTKELHNFLKGHAGVLGYIFRPLETHSNGTLPLVGYGAELQFKSTEYKAQDDSEAEKVEEPGKPVAIGGFLFDKLHELHPDLKDSLDKFQNHLSTITGKQSGFEALKAWQVQELALQAAHYTTLQEGVLDALIDVSGNFPSRAAALSNIRVPSTFKKSVLLNQRILQSHFNLDEGDGGLFLQGNFVDPDAMDLFTFMDSLDSELELMENLRAIYHEKPQSRSQVQHVLGIGSKGSAEPELALDLRDSSVYWVNDLETDDEYEDWPDDLTQLFYRMGGMMLRPVRRNVFNLVLTLNPDDLDTTGAMLKMAHSFMSHKAPLRVGLVFCPPKEKEIISNSLDPLEETAETTGEIVRRVLNYALSESKIRKAFNLVVEAYTKRDFSALYKRLNSPGEEFDFGADLACEFVQKSGRPTPGAFLNGIPLKWDSLDDFEEIVLNQLLREAQNIQIDAYNGKIRDSTNIFEYIMDRPHVQTRLNDKILDTSTSTYLSFGNEIWEPGKEPKNPIAALVNSLPYFVPHGKRHTNVSITLHVLADLTTPDGVKFLQNSLEFLQESAKHSRLSLIPTSTQETSLQTLVIEAISENDLKKALKLLRESELSGLGNSKLIKTSKALELLKRIGFPAGGKGLIVNGRVIGPLDPKETFEMGDWVLVEKFAYDSCAKYFEDDGETGDRPMRICSALGQPKIKSKNLKRFALPEFEKPFLLGSKSGKEPGSSSSGDPYYVDLVAVIDPASRHAHKLAAILSVVEKSLSQWVRIQLLFNPPAKHSELPLKSYFRYIAGGTSGEVIRFENIPRDPLFTLNLIAPDNWMIEAVKAVHDLDNIRLKDLPQTQSITSEYELANLLVEGHCTELKTGSPPRGLQFKLNSFGKQVKVAETIVMANLGYFQLKAQPGVWELALREGPSKEIFAIETQNLKPISVQSFQSVVVKVKVRRNPGQELTSLLDTEAESEGSWFGFGNNKKMEPEDEVINVFSLASGHLYERLLKIMMLSVLKNTKSKVKFWFLKNYLSPTIKDILPEMAKEYNFEYELVQYHWPRWLNPQREKQRIIWGYKILFLDVLFPLSLKKIVFVDADQVVRTDLMELFNLDLEGNPYGYTPFCDSRVEMEGFRFWKTGYWRSHLGKRKYHISALYVVDLVRFRRVAAGDRLRGQYQALSQDPNSLSNLDQDLPNNMIHQVGIKSLPQDWLWCEAWCDDASKATAKTIDLCNNPLTKESKLEAAQRIIPEWKDYDKELRDFQARIRPKVNNKHDEL